MKKGVLLSLFAIFAVLAASLATFAQGRSSNVVKVQARPDSATIQSGKQFHIVISVDINDGFHINSNKPLQDYLQPAQVELDPLKGLTYGAVAYPKPLMQKFSFSPDELSVYAGHITIQVPVKADKTFTTGTLQGKLQIQACNDKYCLAPASVKFEVPITVSDPKPDNTAAQTKQQTDSKATTAKPPEQSKPPIQELTVTPPAP